MAVGKGSMARAAKAATKAPITAENTVKAATVAAPAKEVEKVVAPKKAESAKPKATVKKKETAKPKATTKPKTAPKAPKTSVMVPDAQVMEKIVYQSSSQVLYRDAESNETFGVGDSMPIYLF